MFVGYSDIHKGYKCFHPSSKKFFISRHVVFDESFFPYKTNRHHTISSPTQHVVSIFDSWLPHTNSSSCADLTAITTVSASAPPCSNPLMQSPALQLPIASFGQPEQPSLPEHENLESQHSPIESNPNLFLCSP